MRRLRTSYLDDREDMEVTENARVRIFGVSIHPLAALGAMAAVVVLLIAVMFISQADWFPKSTAVRWTITGASIVVLMATIGVCAMALFVMGKTIRNSRMQLAKLDGATDEEARRETGRFLWKHVYLRLGAYFAATLTLWAVLGTRWVFDWGGPFPYLGGMMVLAAVFVSTGTYRTGQFFARLFRTDRR